MSGLKKNMHSKFGLLTPKIFVEIISMVESGLINRGTGSNLIGLYINEDPSVTTYEKK